MPEERSKLLSISIPTLNGETYLEETVRSVALQIGALDDVEILVVDNASQDTTPEICARLASEFKYFRYTRNDSTRTFDANVNTVVADSESEYVWILADDDVLKPGAVSEVRQALLLSKPEVLLVNFAVVDAELRLLERHDVSVTTKPATQVWQEAGSALLGAGFEIFGLLSAIVIKQASWVRESATLPQSKKDGFEFLYLVPRLMMLGSTVYVGQQLVLFRQYPKRWQVRNDYSQELEIFFVVIPSTLQRLLKVGFDRKVIELLWRHHLSNLTLQIEIAKRRGFKWNRALFFDLMKVNRSQAVFWVQAPFILMPGAVLSLVKRMYENQNTARVLRALIRVRV